LKRLAAIIADVKEIQQSASSEGAAADGGRMPFSRKYPACAE
jgi:hypothetical protein